MKIYIRNPKELEYMKQAGSKLGSVFDRLQDEIRPGHGEQSDRAVCTFTRDDCGKSTGAVAGR